MLIASCLILLNSLVGAESHLEEAFAKLYPETSLEEQIIASPEWIEGASWGMPRAGHPEGAVIYHILEVLDNVEAFHGNSPLREKLRVIAMVHDTFKHKVDISRRKSGENHHAMIARRFAEKLTHDEAILEVIQRHDDAYHAWQKGMKGDWERAAADAYKLIDILGPYLELYIAFYECDIYTGTKTPEPIDWFKEVLNLKNCIHLCID